MKPPNYNFFREVIKVLRRIASEGATPSERDATLCEAEGLLHEHCEGNIASLCAAIESVDAERGRLAREWATERFEAWVLYVRRETDADVDDLVQIHEDEFGPFSEERITEALESLTPGYAKCFLYIAEKRRRDALRAYRELT